MSNGTEVLQRLRTPKRIGNVKVCLHQEDWTPPTNIECEAQLGRGLALLSELRLWLNTFSETNDYLEFQRAKRAFGELSSEIANWRADPIISRAMMFTTLCLMSVIGNSDEDEVVIPSDGRWLSVLHPEILELVNKACSTPVSVHFVDDNSAARGFVKARDEDKNKLIDRLFALDHVREFLARSLAPEKASGLVVEHAQRNATMLLESVSRLTRLGERLIEPFMLCQNPPHPSVCTTDSTSEVASAKHDFDEPAGSANEAEKRARKLIAEDPEFAERMVKREWMKRIRCGAAMVERLQCWQLLNGGSTSLPAVGTYHDGLADPKASSPAHDAELLNRLAEEERLETQRKAEQDRRIELAGRGTGEG